MIAVDYREGSKHLVNLLPPGLAQLSNLPYGDVAFYGVGPGGDRVGVGIECKKVADMAQCLHTGRFVGHQLPGMLLAYGYLYLLIEGITRPGPNDQLQVLRAWSNGKGGDWVDAWGGGRLTYSAWEGHLQTLRRKTPLRIVHTTDPAHTATMVLLLYKWWAHGGGWDSHKSHGGVHVTPDPYTAPVTLPLHLRTAIKVAQQLPGVRDVLAVRVAERFPTVGAMVRATAAEWAEIEGLGGVRVNTILNAINGPNGVTPVVTALLRKSETEPTTQATKRKRKKG